ncbi:hypothetical protein [Burkholderia sp. BE17]|uniref:hypothetical protein n=1 Tax=Burkholderia sp. BE17 TaxID=2656644 RepID=UPI00128C06EE|nr:hypothetical protein [Burkholderia sp. BE17]MPV64342.1 hypothetical protein [Burkholderia sp. BE17]
MRKILNMLSSRRGIDHATANVEADVLNAAICSVAILVDDRVAFDMRATVVGRQVTPGAIDMLVSRLHTPTTPIPEAFEPNVRGLGAWLTAWQFAVFEILLQFRESALGVLREIAWGEYDWTQGNALEILVRLAAKGVGRGHTIADLHREFSRVSDEAKRYAVGPLLHRAKFEPEVAAIVSELHSVPDWCEVVREIEGSCR